MIRPFLFLSLFLLLLLGWHRVAHSDFELGWSADATVCHGVDFFAGVPPTDYWLSAGGVMLRGGTLVCPVPAGPTYGGNTRDDVEEVQIDYVATGPVGGRITTKLITYDPFSDDSDVCTELVHVTVADPETWTDVVDFDGTICSGGEGADVRWFVDLVIHYYPPDGAERWEGLHPKRIQAYYDL